jgi:transposase InsO family protein
LSIKGLCEWLGVSRSGYYAWLNRRPSKRHKDDVNLKRKILRIYDEHKGRYGSPRIYKTLKSQGQSIGKKRVERLMRDLDIVGRVAKVTYRAPGLKRHAASGKNLRLGNVPPNGINEIWVADITYLKVNNQWCFLSVIMDLYSRRVIAWSLDRNRTASTTSRALRSAIKTRNPQKGLILHTDRGVEYRGKEYQEIMVKHGIKHSLNRAGHCTDNAHMESFFHSMKAELIRGNSFKTEQHLRYSIASYINQYYNAKRMHSGINYQSPIQYERMAA